MSDTCDFAAHEYAKKLGLDIRMERGPGGRMPIGGRGNCHVKPRHILAWALKDDPRGFSLPEIAHAVGYRSHTTLVALFKKAR